MKQSVIFFENSNDQLEVKFCAVPDWDEFEVLPHEGISHEKASNFS